MARDLSILRRIKQIRIRHYPWYDWGHRLMILTASESHGSFDEAPQVGRFGLRGWLYYRGLHAAVHLKKPFTCQATPGRNSGGYDHWYCQLRRRHSGGHRFRNYVWAEGGNVLTKSGGMWRSRETAPMWSAKVSKWLCRLHFQGGRVEAARRWTSAAEIPSGVTVTAPVCTSDTRMRWTRCGLDFFVRTYPGSHPVTVTAVEMDKHAGDAGWVEVQR